MPVSKAQIKAQTKWEAKAFDKVLVRIRKDGYLTRDVIAEAAAASGESLNAYILEAVKRRIEQGN